MSKEKTPIKVSPNEQEGFSEEALEALAREGYSLDVVETKGRFLLSDDTEFKRLLKHSALFATESPVVFTDEGIECSWLDSATVAFGQFKMPADEFVEYEARGEARVPTAFYRLAEILVDKPSRASAEYVYEEPNKHFTLNMRSESANRSFDIPFPEKPVTDKKSMPNTERFPDPSGAMIDAAAFYEEIKSAEKHFESVELVLDPEDGLLRLQAQGDDDLSLDVDIPVDVKLAGDDPARARFSTEYLKKLFHGNKGLQYFADEVYLRLSNDHPCLFTARWGAGCEYTILIAPRISNDDE